MSGRGQGGRGLGFNRMFGIGENIKDDVVNNLKNWISTKGSNFLIKWKSNISSKKIDENMKKMYIEQQQREDDHLANDILKNILNSIQHVGIDSILSSMKNLSEKFHTALNGEKFYIILNPSEVHECTPGSNMFTSILYLILNQDLLPLLENFICGDVLLNGNNIDSSIEQYLYVDDIAISGKDVKKAILSTQEYIEPETKLHMMIPYCSKVAHRAINSGFKELNSIRRELYGITDSKIAFALYMDEKIVPKTLVEQKWLKPSMDTWKKQKGEGGDIENYFKRVMIFLLGQNKFNKGDVTSLNKITLFYTDITAPSDDSMYPMLLFKPTIFVPSDNQLKHLTGSIVSGCRVAETETELNMARKGEFCITPPHKNTAWTVFIQNLNSLDSKSSVLGEVAAKNDDGETIREIKRVFVEEPIIEKIVEEPKEEEMNMGEIQFLLSKEDGYTTETMQDIYKRFSGDEEKTMAEIKNRLFKRCEMKESIMTKIHTHLFGGINKRARTIDI